MTIVHLVHVGSFRTWHVSILRLQVFFAKTSQSQLNMSQDSDVSPEQFYSVDASQTLPNWEQTPFKNSVVFTQFSAQSWPQMAEPQVTHGDPWWPGWARRRDCESCWRVSADWRVLLGSPSPNGTRSGWNAALVRPERSNQEAVKMAPWQSH